MKQTINLSQFRTAFYDMDRKENFTYEGLEALFEYLEQYEQDCGEEIELDVIALCCEYTEYENLEEFNKEHDEAKSIEEIEERTQVIRVGAEGFIIQQY